MVIMVVSILISLPLLILAYIVIKQSFEANREARHIRKNGTSAEAIISSIRQTDNEINGHPEVFIGLTIPRDEAEPLRTIVKTLIYMANIPQYQPGRKVQVKMLEVDGKIKVILEGAPIF